MANEGFEGSFEHPTLDSPVSPSPSLSSIKSFKWSNLLVNKTRHRKFLRIKGRDPASIERSNLVNISKLIVKELIEQSLRYGRMLDSDHVPLQHFFIVLEHVLRHGLKPKKGLLGPKKELWDILQLVEKYSSEAQDITNSVRDLPTVRTHIGRARAWLRVALMQKKLADYLKILIDHKDEGLVDYFEPDALMLSDEVIVIIGLLVGLNVIDCNLCVKEEDLDCPQGVIDFSLYLRSTPQVLIEADSDEPHNNMTTVLDQKNYIEELNRHLNATVANLQNKIEAVTTTNALMKEDLAIAKSTLMALFEENKQLKMELGRDTTGYCMSTSGVRINKSSEDTVSSHSEDSSSKVVQLEGDRDGESQSESATESELRIKCNEEYKLRREAERELQLQLSLKAEIEVAMKLLEREVTDKHATIISLKQQLDEIKLINMDMYKKLQANEMSLDQKAKLVERLEDKSHAMNAAMIKLENKFRECDSERLVLQQKQKEIDEQKILNEKLIGSLENDLKAEKEWRISLQERMQQDRTTIAKFQSEIVQLKMVAQKYAGLQEEYYTLKEQCLEQEQTLIELGKHLSKSKMQVSDMKEVMATSRTAASAHWVQDNSTPNCTQCGKEFSLTRRRHHCRKCGQIFCSSCSDNFVVLDVSPSSPKSHNPEAARSHENTTSTSTNSKGVRVCDQCRNRL